MRVVLDTNIWISYLLTPTEYGTIATLVRACFSEGIKLIVPQALLDELLATWQKKKYLRNRITEAQAQELVELLSVVAEIPSTLPEIERVVRDPKDDYLVAYALVTQADYLVTGDDDLLVLGEIDGLAIIDPVEFLGILREKGIVAP